ncbi:MAG: hypothetical protein E7448_06325 [Ruminococcaceae bacterium]|nr:hypothetical protein [Oscillospiraceae bacterium]
MRLFKKKQGLEKVKFWLIILIILLIAAGGLRLGQALPDQIALPDTFFDTGKEAVWSVLQPYLQLFEQNPVAFWIVIALGLIIVGAILFLCYRHRPNKRNAPQFSWDFTVEDIRIFLYIITAVFFTWSGSADAKLTRLMSADLGIITIAAIVQMVLVLQDVYVKRNSEDYVYFEQNKKSVLIKTTLIGLALVGLPLWIPDFWGFTLPQVLPNADLLEYYAAILSLTFISISVMSMLSDRTVVIYWENIAEGKLIKPVFGSFAAFTYYSIGAAVGAGICVALNNTAAFLIFCCINIATIILLTYTMVDVYYDRDSKKARRVQELHEDLHDYIWVAENDGKDENETQASPDKDDEQKYTDQEIKDMRIGYRRYEEKMILLCQNISRANDEHDLIYLQEVYELYCQNLNCFNTPIGRRVVEMLFADCAAEGLPLLMRSIRDILDNMEAQQASRNEQEDPFPNDFFRAGKAWNQDESLWRALANSQQLRQWLQNVCDDHMDTEELRDFLRLIARRLVILYNDMVAHYNIVNPTAKCQYLQVTLRNGCIWIETTQGEKPNPEQISDVFGALFGELVVESTFAARLMQFLYMILENLSEHGRTTLQVYLHNFPLPEQFTPYMATLGFEDDMIDFWTKYFPEEA